MRGTRLRSIINEMLVKEGRCPIMKISKVNVKKRECVQARVRKKTEEPRKAD